jgi:hypothetical protein
MLTTIDQYREAKATYEKLHSQAKKDLLARFQELANELLRIQKELREDFGTKVAIPSKRKTVRRAGKTATPASGPALKRAAPAAPNPAIARTEKKLATQKRKLEEAVRAGQDGKAIKDRIYELEDELRLAKE